MDQKELYLKIKEISKEIKDLTSKINDLQDTQSSLIEDLKKICDHASYDEVSETELDDYGCYIGTKRYRECVKCGFKEFSKSKYGFSNRSIPEFILT